MFKKQIQVFIKKNQQFFNKKLTKPILHIKKICFINNLKIDIKVP